MLKHKKTLLTGALLFTGVLGMSAVDVHATESGQSIQDLRYCSINNIYTTPRKDCPLFQNRIPDSFSGKQDGTGYGRAAGPRIPNCPNYEEKQTQQTPAQPESTPQTQPAAPVEPTTTTYDTQPQDGTGYQYGQQANAVNNLQQNDTNVNNGSYGNGQQNGYVAQQNDSAPQQNNNALPQQPSNPAPQNDVRGSGTHHGLRDGTGAGGQRCRNAGHCY